MVGLVIAWLCFRDVRLTLLVFVVAGYSAALSLAVVPVVRVPLNAFTGVNLNAVRSVQFTFNERVQGGVLITDVAFASAP